MSENTNRGDEVPTILYTVEAKASTKQTTEDLKVEDPLVETAIAVLRGEEPHREHKTH